MEGDKFSKELYHQPSTTLEIFNHVIDFLTADKKGQIIVFFSTPESRRNMVSKIKEYLDSRNIKFSMKRELSHLIIDIDGKEVVFMVLLSGELQIKKRTPVTRMRFPERLELRDEKQGISADILIIKTGEKQDNGDYKIIEVEYKVLDILYDVKVKENNIKIVGDGLDGTF